MDIQYIPTKLPFVMFHQQRHALVLPVAAHSYHSYSADSLKPDLAALRSPVHRLAGLRRPGLLQAVCVGPAFAWLPAEPRQELAQREEVFINVYWSSRENLTDRTAAAAHRRQQKGRRAFWKHLSRKIDAHTGMNVHFHMLTHTHTCKWI